MYTQRQCHTITTVHSKHKMTTAAPLDGIRAGRAIEDRRFGSVYIASRLDVNFRRHRRRTAAVSNSPDLTRSTL